MNIKEKYSSKKGKMMEQWNEINVNHNHVLWPQFSKAIKSENLIVTEAEQEKLIKIRINNINKSKTRTQPFFDYYKIVCTYIEDGIDSISFYENIDEKVKVND